MRNPDASAASGRISWLFGILLVVTVIGVFGAVGQHDFVAWDDDLHVLKNPRLQPVSWSHVWAFWQAPYQHLYMPLTYSAWGALVWLSQTLTPGQLHASWFHLFNLLLHTGSVLVVYRIGIIVLGQNRPVPAEALAAAAAVAALLFGLHPLQVEPVAWVSGLKDVLCGLWAMVAIWQYLESCRGRRRRHYTMASVAFGLALLAKPAAVVVPLVAAVLAVGGLRQRYRTVGRTLAGWVVMALGWSLWTKWQQPDAVLGDVPAWWARPVVAADAMTFYLGKLWWPLRLGPDYGRTPQVVLADVWGYVPALIVMGMVLVLWHRRRQMPGVALAALVFAAALLPVLGLVPFLFQAYSTVADRYVYLALLGPALGWGWSLLRVRPGRPVWIVSLLLLGVLGWRSVGQVQVWRDSMALFTHAVQVNPGSAVAHHNLGWALAQQGRMQQAVEHYRRALELKPTMLEAYYNLGDALAAQGKLDEAIVQYTTVLRFQPAWAEVHNNLGTVLRRRGDLKAAIRHYTEAVRLKPDWSLPYNNIGDAMARQGKLKEAMGWFAQAMQRAPELPEAAYNLGGLLRQAGRLDAAIAAYREALRRRPRWPQAAEPLAWLLTQQDRPSSRDMAEAVALAELASQASRYRLPMPLRTLAAAYHRAGKWQDAIRTARRALTAARAAGNSSLMAKISKQLERYERMHAIPTPH